ncbi:NAD-binding protein, partial [Salmonella enterica]|uniref:NAD-binding protein n=1 Tax=Salmonella enterica TaxID=28901 RepID=UPI00079B173A
NNGTRDIGCGMASNYHGKKLKVDLINKRDRLLTLLDQEMSDSHSYHIRNSGVDEPHNEENEKIEGCVDGVNKPLKSRKKQKAA